MQNRNITLLNFHAALQRYSNKTLDVFGGVYFLTHGVSFPIVALMWAASFMVRFLLRPISIWLSVKLGLKQALIIGTLASSGMFLVFTQVNGVSIWLAVFVVYLAFYDILYWLPYHAYYAVSGEESQRGRQLALGEVLVSAVQILVPFVGAILATKLGFNYLYVSAMICMILSVIPILFAKDISPGSSMGLRQAWEQIDRRGWVMSIGYGLLSNGYIFIWTIVIFTIAGNLVDFGGLVTAGLLLSTAISLIAGHYIDKGRATVAARIGLVITGVGIVASSLFVTNSTHIVIVSIVAGFGLALLSMAYMVGLYNFAQKSHSTLWFHYFSEAGWDIGSIIAMLIAAGLFQLGISLQHIMLISLAGLVIIDRVLVTKNRS